MDLCHEFVSLRCHHVVYILDMRNTDTLKIVQSRVQYIRLLYVTNVCIACKSSHTTSPFLLGQYVSLSGGRIVVPVTDLVTGQRSLSVGVSLVLSVEECPLGTMLRCSRFLLISPCGVSTKYDLGALACPVTLPDEGVEPEVTHTSVFLGIGGRG